MPQVDPTSNIEATLLKRPTLTQEDERPTVSRELHAELTQVLGALLTHVQDLLDDPRPSGYARTRLQKIRALGERRHSEV
jgi:signal transduction histidine kinase